MLLADLVFVLSYANQLPAVAACLSYRHEIGINFLIQHLTMRTLPWSYWEFQGSNNLFFITHTLPIGLFYRLKIRSIRLNCQENTSYLNVNIMDLVLYIGLSADKDVKINFFQPCREIKFVEDIEKLAK